MSTHQYLQSAGRTAMFLARLVWLTGIVLLACPAWGEFWPQFRGPTGLGYTTEAHLPLAWGGPEGRNVLWQSSLIGQGHASPIVWNGLLFVSTVHWPDSVTDRTKVIPEHHVLCYATTNGAPLWDALITPGPWLRTDFRSGPGGGYAAPTPTTDGQRVFVAFGSSVIAALDLQGTVIWRKEIIPFTFDVTLGSSPVLYGDTLILLCAMARPEDSRLLALDKRTREVTWEVKLPTTQFGHSTPVIIHPAGQPQLIVIASGGGQAEEGLQSFDPRSGRRLWWCQAAGDAASPAYGAGIVYVDSGRGGPGVAVDPTGAGDLTASHVKWRVPQVPEGIGSPIIVGDYVYRLHNPAILKCWKADTGKTVYSERLEGLSTTWASPIADRAGRLYYANAGRSYVVKVGPTFQVLATNDLGDPNHASPAVSEGRLYLVGTRNVYCVGFKE